MAVKNHNFRFNMEKDNEVRAWEILHSKEVKEDFRSQNEFVIAMTDILIKSRTRIWKAERKRKHLRKTL